MERYSYVSFKQPLKLVENMAKRRTDIGKKRKHGGDRLEIPREATAKGHKKIFVTAVLTVVIVALISISAYYLLVISPSEKEKDVLTSDASHGEGNLSEEITFGFTIYNPEKESDTFSTLISGLPSDWEVSLPEIITEGGKKNKN